MTYQLVNPQQDFIDYCLSFYGIGGIYDMAYGNCMTQAQAHHAVGLISQYGTWGGGDSTDREEVMHFCRRIYGLELA